MGDLFKDKQYICLNLAYSCGLNDMKDRFTEFLKLSRIINLTPILPTLYLRNSHTRKSNCVLTDYIEVPDFVCKDMPANNAAIFHWNVRGFLPNDILYKRFESAIQSYPLNINFQEKYRNIAHEIVQQMQKPVCIVHVRRGDQLHAIGSLRTTTSPAHIIDTLKKHTFNDCYIKTDETNPTYFAELKKGIDIKCYADFPTLKSIHESGDNYALYSIECCIRDLCDIRISTFNTTKSEQWWMPNNDANYFNDYLDDHKGYQ